MDIAELLADGAVMPALKAGSKRQVLNEFATKARDVYGLDHRVVVEGLVERERLGSTAMGGGVAIPHMRLEGIDRIHGLFARLEKPVDFEAADGMGVDLIFAIIAPEACGADHLKALAKVSRLFRNNAVCAKLRASRDATALHALLTDAATSRAA